MVYSFCLFIQFQLVLPFAWSFTLLSFQIRPCPPAMTSPKFPAHFPHMQLINLISHSVYIPVHFPLFPARLSSFTVSSQHTDIHSLFFLNSSSVILDFVFSPAPCRIWLPSLIDSLVLGSLPVILDFDSLPTPYWTCLLPLTDPGFDSCLSSQINCGLWTVTCLAVSCFWTHLIVLSLSAHLVCGGSVV